jgi:hypothetical protein
VGILLVGGAAGWLVSQGDTHTSEAGPPVIRADERPIKVHPDEPGGLAVPNRDRLIYRRLQGESDKPVVERLLPGPEQPLPLPGRSTAPETAGPAPEPPIAAAPAAVSPPPAPPVPEPAAAQAASSTPSPPAKATVTSADAKAGQAASTAKMAPPDAAAKAKTAPPPAKEKLVSAAPTVAVDKATAAAKASPTGRVYQVQILAARSEDAAKAAWSDLKSKHPELLSGLSASVSRKELSDRGTFYRLRAGSFDSEAKAKALCGKLAGRNVSCVIVQPQG